ncbi:tetratricopeptide repeat protein [Glacieibacterium frigidum]|uniref:Tetratricopeptide repeat protein 38 n=1 Tax=Glacieibacterium frigidum TaxID=2593303 RepID=A0A552UH37_9SPHN|nr:tetratricopeptide repeat protein [Glacieibacterium frigidum]TRW17535.1 tetratricopeptide repeat protein [Glacieibacterium frigidum]
MLQRSNGLVLTTADPRDAVAVDAAEAALLRYGKDVALYLDSPAASGDCVYGLALAAAFNLMAMTAPAAARARPLIAAAERHVRGATPHERAFVAAVADWGRGDLTAAIARHRRIAEAWPTDLLSAKILHFHQINTGDFAGMLASLGPIVAAQPGLHYVHGMRAFALEQCGETRAAEIAGRHAASLGNDPWAHHAVAHVLDTEGRAREGRDWIAATSAGWEGCSSFMLTHNWWHAALFEITLGDHDAALDIFDTRVWGVRRDCCQDQVNAVSLLARLELVGLDVGDRWHDLAPHLAARIDDRANPFVDLHYAYGLARAGADEPLGALFADLAIRAELRRPLDIAAATAARAMTAHARRRYDEAAEAFATLGPTIGLGGSHTQRQLIDLCAVDARARRTDSGRVIHGGWSRPYRPTACAA